MKLPDEARVHVMNMCKYATLAGEATYPMEQIEELLVNTSSLAERGHANHVQMSMDINRINQIVRECLSVFESIIGVSVEDTYKSINSAEHGETVLSSSAHVGNQITRCKEYLSGEPSIAAEDLLREVHYALGNMLFTALELYVSMVYSYGEHEDFFAMVDGTAAPQSLEDIFNKDGALEKGYTSYDNLKQMVLNDVSGLQAFENPFAKYGVDFFVHNKIDAADEEDVSGGPEAPDFDEISEENFNW